MKADEQRARGREKERKREKSCEADKGRKEERERSDDERVENRKFVSRVRTEETRWPLVKGKRRPHTTVFLSGFTRRAASRRGNVLAY